MPDVAIDKLIHVVADPSVSINMLALHFWAEVHSKVIIKLRKCTAPLGPILRSGVCIWSIWTQVWWSKTCCGDAWAFVLTPLCGHCNMTPLWILETISEGTFTSQCYRSVGMDSGSTRYAMISQLAHTKNTSECVIFFGNVREFWWYDSKVGQISASESADGSYFRVIEMQVDSGPNIVYDVWNFPSGVNQKPVSYYINWSSPLKSLLQKWLKYWKKFWLQDLDLWPCAPFYWKKVVEVLEIGPQGRNKYLEMTRVDVLSSCCYGNLSLY